MLNPITEKLLESGLMEICGDIIVDSYDLGEKISTILKTSKMKVEYHFDGQDGSLIFDKVLGRDKNNNFYNEDNSNLKERESDIKLVIVGVILDEYNSLVTKKGPR